MVPILLTGEDEQQLFLEAIEEWAKANNLTPVRLNHPDIITLPSDGEDTSIGIQEIRAFNKSLLFKPLSAVVKLAVIRNAHRLTPEAQNALLKTLEEPPGHVHIYLTTKMTHSLLETVKSRVITRKGKTSKVALGSMNNAEMVMLLDPFSRLVHVSVLGATSEKAGEFLAELLQFLHQKLIQNQELLQVTQAIDLTLSAQKKLEANVHHQLLLDNLFINLPQLGTGLENNS